MDNLQVIVEEIGRIADIAEFKRWDVADHIADAFHEFPAYERGLTSGLCQRLKRSSDSIYNMRNASNLRAHLKVSTILSVSHFVALSDLQKKYMLTDETLIDWISRAVDDSLSVRDLRSEVAIEHELDVRAHWKRKVSRVAKQMTVILQDAESAGVPNELWQIAKVAHSCVSDFADKVSGWS